MSRKDRPVRKFIKERRNNACPACLDREERYEGLPERTNFSRTSRGVIFKECEMCGRWDNGTVTEVYPVGNEWRRYPWVIVK